LRQRSVCPAAVQCAAWSAAAAFERIVRVPPGRAPTLNITSDIGVVPAAIVLMATLDHITAPRVKVAEACSA
jgi:hypothetical protein